jgi:hypothetical protein
MHLVKAKSWKKKLDVVWAGKFQAEDGVVGQAS